MIAESLIVTGGVVVIAMTWLGMRLAERHVNADRPTTRADQDTALRDAERFIMYRQHDAMRALLAVRPHHLPDDVRARAQAWLDARPS